MCRLLKFGSLNLLETSVSVQACTEIISWNLQGLSRTYKDNILEHSRPVQAFPGTVSWNSLCLSRPVQGQSPGNLRRVEGQSPGTLCAFPGLYRDNLLESSGVYKDDLQEPSGPVQVCTGTISWNPQGLSRRLQGLLYLFYNDQ